MGAAVHRHLAGVPHARAWLTMREQVGLAPNLHSLRATLYRALTSAS